MTPVRQRHLAIVGAVALVVALVAANVHLVVTAVASQPACTALPDGPAPARRSC